MGYKFQHLKNIIAVKQPSWLFAALSFKYREITKVPKLKV